MEHSSDSGSDDHSQVSNALDSVSNDSNVLEILSPPAALKLGPKPSRGTPLTLSASFHDFTRSGKVIVADNGLASS